MKMSGNCITCTLDVICKEVSTQNPHNYKHSDTNKSALLTETYVKGFE